MLEEYLKQLKEKYGMNERKDTGFETFKLAGMQFTVKACDCEELGHVSYMCASDTSGLMKMESMVINPLVKDAPLLSIDLIKAMEEYSLYLEQYDTNLDAPRKEEGFSKIIEKYKDAVDQEAKKYWYDDIRYATSMTLKKTSDEVVTGSLKEYFEEYLHILDEAETCDRTEKQKKARSYSHGLLEHGGPATDNFLKNWGKEKTEEFFDQVMFG